MKYPNFYDDAEHLDTQNKNHMWEVAEFDKLDEYKVFNKLKHYKWFKNIFRILHSQDIYCLQYEG